MGLYFLAKNPPPLAADPKFCFTALCGSLRCFAVGVTAKHFWENYRRGNTFLDWKKVRRDGKKLRRAGEKVRRLGKMLHRWLSVAFGKGRRKPFSVGNSQRNTFLAWGKSRRLKKALGIGEVLSATPNQLECLISQKIPPPAFRKCRQGGGGGHLTS